MREPRPVVEVVIESIITRGGRQPMFSKPPAARNIEARSRSWPSSGARTAAEPAKCEEEAAILPKVESRAREPETAGAVGNSMSVLQYHVGAQRF